MYMYESIYKRALSDFCLYMQHVQWMSIFLCLGNKFTHTFYWSCLELITV